MDSLSQAALGAAIGEAILGKKIGHKAAITGAVVGTVPDLDVLLIPFFNELQKISIHRGYSHSLLFCIVGAFLFSLPAKSDKMDQRNIVWKALAIQFPGSVHTRPSRRFYLIRHPIISSFHRLEGQL